MTYIYKKLPISDDAGFLSLHDVFTKHTAKIYAVGGCVRDSIINSDTHAMPYMDIDIATPLNPTKIIDILDKESIKYLTMGLEFGTITACIENKTYEITSFRQDIITNGRHGVVAYTDNMMLDAQRRDFTINALYYDNAGILYDPLMCGIQDLHKKKINFIGVPHDRIIEDYLRILRYFRFLARFGFDSYDKHIFSSFDYKTGLEILSPHRIISELKKMIHYPFACDSLRGLCDLNYDAILFKGLNLNIALFKKFQDINVNSDYLLSSLLYQNDAKHINKNVLLSRQDRRKAMDFANIYDAMYQFFIIKDWAGILELQYDYNMSLWHDVLLLIAESDNHQDITKIKNSIVPKFDLNGKDLLSQGHNTGKHIGNILKQRRRQFIQEYLSNL